jgi:hypothetical protein
MALDCCWSERRLRARSGHLVQRRKEGRARPRDGAPRLVLGALWFRSSYRCSAGNCRNKERLGRLRAGLRRDLGAGLCLRAVVGAWSTVGSGPVPDPLLQSVPRSVVRAKRTFGRPFLSLPGFKARSAAGQRPTAPSGGRFCTVTSRTSGGGAEG